MSVTSTMTRTGTIWADWSARRLKRVEKHPIKQAAHGDFSFPDGVPMLCEVGLFALEYVAQLFDAFFDLRGACFR